MIKLKSSNIANLRNVFTICIVKPIRVTPRSGMPQDKGLNNFARNIINSRDLFRNNINYLMDTQRNFQS